MYITFEGGNSNFSVKEKRVAIQRRQRQAMKNQIQIPHVQIQKPL